MTHHILVLGNNLTGLVTAYRLVHYGFRITILDTAPDVPSHISPRLGQEANKPLTATALAGPDYQGHPLILHGFYHTTWSLLQELSFEWPSPAAQTVSLEFGNDRKPPVALPKPLRIARTHPLMRLLFFKGLSWSDRWNIINLLEKEWEENRLTDHHPDIQSAENWLIAAKQSNHSRTYFWNPLCRFFLHCNLSEASLSSFIEVFSRYWFGQPTDAATYLTPYETLEKLETHLRQWLDNKGTRFHTAPGTLHFHIENEEVQAIGAGDGNLTAHAYVSALTPTHLLSLVPERALARYAYFSSLAHIPEVYGLTIRFTLPHLLLPPRLILHADSFDWITCQTRSQSNGHESIITCVILQKSIQQDDSLENFVDNARMCIHHLFSIPQLQTLEASQPQVISHAEPFYPCHQGSRTHRPLPKTPLSNFFLAGPWTATNLPISLEGTILSANACAQAVSSAFYGFL